MYAFITILITFICILIMLVVLIQKPKGSGLASSFSGNNQMMGVKKTTELVEKITWGLGIALFVLTIAVNLMIDRGGAQGAQDEIENINVTAPATQTPPPNATPPAGNNQQP